MNLESSNVETHVSMQDWLPSAKAGRRSQHNSKLDPFMRSQQVKLLQLRQRIVESISGVGEDTRTANCEASAMRTHQADTATEANDRDLALGRLSLEHNALYEVDRALQRIESGNYGTCEMSGKQIPRDRLEAIPYARFTVECQSRLEKEGKGSRLWNSTVSFFDSPLASVQDAEEKILAPSDED